MWLLILVGLLAGCRAPEPSPGMSTAEIRFDRLPTVIALVATPTATHAPTPTPTATLVPTPTSTPVPTPTAQPVRRPASARRPHYRMDIALDYGQHRLEVVEQIALANGSEDLWSEVVLSVPSAYWQGAWELRALEQQTGTEQKPAESRMENTMLHVPLAEPLAAGQALTIQVTFVLTLPHLSPSWWVPEGNFGWGERLIQVGDWHPTLVPYRRGAGWLTWNYRPVGDPTVNEAATYDVRIAAGPEVVIAAPGFQKRQGGVWQFHGERWRSFAFLASPEYRTVDADADGVRVRSFYLAGDEREGQVVLDTAMLCLDLFGELYGPYPYPDLTLAQNGYYGAMEYSGLVSQSGYAYEHYEEVPSAMLVSLTAHEIGHQWWFGAVGNDQVHEPWLDEPLATYSELLFYERYAANYAGWWWDRHIELWQPEGRLDRTIYDFDGTWSYIRNVYGQGTKFLHDVRSVLGGEAFFAFLRDYRKQNEGRLARGTDFLDALCAHTEADSRFALNLILDQYFDDARPCR